MLLGLIVGLVAFGPAGYLVAANLASPSPAASPSASRPSSAAPTLPPFERSQLAINKDKAKGDLATLTTSWLPYVSGCINSDDKAGPKPGAGEAFRLTCHYGAVTVNFVQYQTAADRDKARARRVQWNADARQTMPGTGDPAEKKSASGNANGNYLEYGYKSDDGRLLAGLWWDNTETPVAGFLAADWRDVLGGSWGPMRDLWQRYS